MLMRLIEKKKVMKNDGAIIIMIIDSEGHMHAYAHAHALALMVQRAALE